MVVAPLQPPKLALVPAPAANRAAPKPPPGRIAADDPRIARAAAGDRAAAETLLTQLLPRVRNLVRYLCRGDGEVDDHAQVALLEVLRALPAFEGRSAFTTWADRITVRSTLRRIQQARTRALRQPPVAETDASSGEDPGPERRALGRRRLARLLDALPPEQREALVLHHVVGMSVPEVARELDLPFDTIKSRLRLATQRLRKLHTDTAGDDHAR